MSEFATNMGIIGKDMARKIAEEIISVHPTDPEIFSKIKENSMTREELIVNGYEPVSKLGLMWVKKEQD